MNDAPTAPKSAHERLVVDVRVGPDRQPKWEHVEGSRAYATFIHEGRRLLVVEMKTRHTWRLETGATDAWAQAALQAFARAHGYRIGHVGRRSVDVRVARDPQSGSLGKVLAVVRRRRVLAALAGAPRHAWELQTECKVPKRALLEILRQFIAEGLVEKRVRLYARITDVKGAQAALATVFGEGSA